MNVLAFVDRSHYSASVCDHAAWASQRLDIPVELLHVIERLPDALTHIDRSGRLGLDTGEELLRELAMLDEQRNKVAQEGGRMLLEEAARRTHKGGASKVAQRLGHGELVDQLRDHEARARLIVMGKEGEAASQAKSHLGRNLERVIRASHRPVLIASETFRPIRTFLFAYDGGKSAGEAVHYLVNSPLLHEAEGEVLLVGRGGEPARTHLSDATRHLRSAGMTITETNRDGEPAQVIAEAVTREGADLLVMGAYGHSRIRQLMIGSTTTEVMRMCPISMLVFH